MHHVVAAFRDDRPQPQQRSELGIARHPQVTHPYAVGADLLGHGAGVVQRQHIGFMPGVANQHRQLDLGTPRLQAGNNVQDLHGRLPFTAM
jgi:hypothetical protein